MSVTATDAAERAAPVAAAAPRRRLRIEGLLFPFGLLLLAEILFDLSNIQSDSIAAPSSALMAGIGAFRDGSMLQATADTLIAAFGGLAMGGSVGLVLGLLLGTIPVLDRLMEFTIEAVRPIPSVALIPVALLVYGFGYRMEIAVVTFASTWPVLIMTRSAVAGIEPRLIEVARALRFNVLQRIWKIVLPAALPRIFVGFRLAAGVALIVAVTCEISANPLGLGYGMMMAEQSLHPDLMLAFLIWIGVVGWGLNWCLVTAQNRLFGPAGVVERPR
jgi:ABC-type nitrate/sulfonate/bicarbonate transport system permease component